MYRWAHDERVPKKTKEKIALLYLFNILTIYWQLLTLNRENEPWAGTYIYAYAAQRPWIHTHTQNFFFLVTWNHFDNSIFCVSFSLLVVVVVELLPALPCYGVSNEWTGGSKMPVLFWTVVRWGWLLLPSHPEHCVLTCDDAHAIAFTEGEAQPGGEKICTATARGTQKSIYF